MARHQLRAPAVIRPPPPSRHLSPPPCPPQVAARCFATTRGRSADGGVGGGRSAQKVCTGRWYSRGRRPRTSSIWGWGVVPAQGGSEARRGLFYECIECKKRFTTPQALRGHTSRTGHF